MKVPMLICFSLKGSTLRKIPSFLSLHQPRTSHEYHLCVLEMITMSRKDVKHVHCSSSEVLSLRLCKWETRMESAVISCGFPYDIVIKLATSLTM